MICGSTAMNKDLRQMLGMRGFVEGSTQTPGDFVVERAFVDS
jgi:ferredoxin--NADP+ reductase